MSLEAGLYHIYTSEGIPVGRYYPDEDTSVRPKLVCGLPPNIKAPTWIIHPVSDDRYKLTTGGAFTAAIDGKVFAVLLQEPKPVEWVIKLHEQHGPNSYTIEEPGTETVIKGWVIPRDPGEEYAVQIEVRFLNLGTSEPPNYPPNELFKIERIADCSSDND